MTKEEKSILLKDLSARLFYRPTVLLGEREHCILCGIDGDEVYLNVDSDSFNVKDIKPFLRPMSSMTEDEYKEYSKLWDLQDEFPSDADIRFKIDVFDWLNSHHFDYRGLIEKGLVLEAPDGMYDTIAKE